MKLTTEQLNILNHVIEDGQAWVNHVETTFPEKSEAMMLAKVEKYRQSYLDAQGGDYQTRKQKEDAYWKEMEEKRLNVSFSVKRQREYPDYREYLDAIVKGDEAQKQKYINDCLAVKAKYPKG